MVKFVKDMLWYRKLNPGHKATAEHPKLTQDDIEKVKISKWQGQLLFVEELEDNLFVETYLVGGYTIGLERAAAYNDSLARRYKETCSIYLPEKERED